MCHRKAFPELLVSGNEIINAYLERQKEQKPVHTAKEMWKEMRLEVYAQASGNRHEPNYSDDSTKMFSLCDIDEIFEKIGNSTVGSQPAEWSEEDEEMLEQAIKCVNNSGKLEVSTEEIEDWLKNLRPYPKQKWGEKDGLHHFLVARSMESITWLKSLKPHWKPSEEQMDALDEYIWAKEPNKNKAKYVISLYEDLKKLM